MVIKKIGAIFICVIASAHALAVEKSEIDNLPDGSVKYMEFLREDGRHEVFVEVLETDFSSSDICEKFENGEMEIINERDSNYDFHGSYFEFTRRTEYQYRNPIDGVSYIKCDTASIPNLKFYQCHDNSCFQFVEDGHEIIMPANDFVHRLSRYLSGFFDDFFPASLFQSPATLARESNSGKLARNRENLLATLNEVLRQQTASPVVFELADDNLVDYFMINLLGPAARFQSQ